MRKFIQTHNRKIRWGVVAMLCLTVLLWYVLDTGWTSYVQSWLGSSFKALSGGCIGWLVSRYIVELDLSKISDEQRSTAALSQAILIGSFALSLATGA